MQEGLVSINAIVYSSHDVNHCDEDANVRRKILLQDLVHLLHNGSEPLSPAIARSLSLAEAEDT